MQTDHQSKHPKKPKGKLPESEVLVTRSEAKSGFISGPPRLFLKSRRPELNEILLERFEPKRCLDSRGAHLVCLAYDRLEQREVALKVQRKAEGVNGTSDLEREAAVGQLLPAHPNVLELYTPHYAPGVDGQPLIILPMEYANGGSLRQWLQQSTSGNPQNTATGLEYFLQLCLGVGALHENGILHLDLKPENALLCSGVIKVADFGAARVSKLAQTSASVDLGPPRSAGTANYRSPEQFTARHVDELTEAADIYALGVILFEMFHPGHRQPFSGTYRRLCFQHQRARPPSIPGLSKAAAEVIECCLAKDPRDRFESVDELIEVLNSLPTANLVSQATDTKPDAPTPADVTPSPSGQGEIQERLAAATALYAEIQQNMAQGDLEELLAMAAKAGELYPGHPHTEVIMVRLGRRVKVYTESIEACLSELQAGRLETAQQFAQQAAAANPKAVEAARLMARVSGHLEQIGRLKAELRSAIRARDVERAEAVAVQLDEWGVPADAMLLSEGGPL